VITLGPYRFTVTDARRTLAHGPHLLEAMGAGRDAAALATIRERIAAAVRDLDPADEGADALVGPLTQVWHALGDAGPALRAAGQLPARAEGRVVQLNVSDGGVPKRPVERVEVGFDGVVGDAQRHRAHHGRPWQALCLWSREVIDAFRADGHPLAPGAAGENVTLEGLPWAEVRPGVRLRLGTVVCEVMSYAPPCRHNAQWFRNGEFGLMHHERGPVSRVYAVVREPGTILTGDPAVLEP
jgi:MOSC domain-containing protein YiiM